MTQPKGDPETDPEFRRILRDAERKLTNKRTNSKETHVSQTNEQIDAAIVPAKGEDFDPNEPTFLLNTSTIGISPAGKDKRRATVKDGDDTLSLVVTRTGRSLDDLETVVNAGMAGMVAAGIALLEIRAFSMWKERTDANGKKYTSFGAYAVGTFGFSRPRIYQLLDIASVAAVLTDAGRTLPNKGAVLQALGRIKDDPALLVATFDVAVTEAGGDPDKLTREGVTDTANEALDKKEAEQAANGSDLSSQTTGSGKAGTGKGKSRGGAKAGSLNSRKRGRRVTVGPKAKAANGNGESGAMSEDDLNDEVAKDLAALDRVSRALQGGHFDVKDSRTTSLIQSVVGRLLCWLAGEWAAGGVGYPTTWVISTTTAKKWLADRRKTAAGEAGSTQEVTPAEAAEARKLDAQAQAAASLTDAQRANLEKNKATVAKAAAKKEEPKSPKVPAETQKLMDETAKARPQTGTQQRRAKAKATAPAPKEEVVVPDASDISLNVPVMKKEKVPASKR